MSRYIEAEEVEKRIDIVLGSEPKAWDKKALKELKMYVVHAVPTADVRENVRGEWIIKTDGFVIKRVWGACSECGNTLDFSGVNAGRGDANFCPNCGADMRGDQT